MRRVNAQRRKFFLLPVLAGAAAVVAKPAAALPGAYRSMREGVVDETSALARPAVWQQTD